MGYRLLLIALLLVGALYTLAARRIPMDPWTAAELINAQTLPILYGGLLILALLVALFRPAATAIQQSARAPVPGGRYLRLAGIGLLVAAFILVLGWLTLWPALGLLLFATAWWLGERRWLPMLALAITVPLAGYLGIELGLGVYLPD